MEATCILYLFWTLFSHKDVIKWNNKEIRFSMILHTQIDAPAD